jgi:hypothetical protein
MTAAEARDWDEYLAWTRDAAPWQYEETEDRAWRRLQLARLHRRQSPYGFALGDTDVELLRERRLLARRAQGDGL